MTRDIMPGMAPSDLSSLRVLTSVLRWDYGKQSRGESSEQRFFVRNLEPLVGQLDSFWYDELLDDTARMNAELLAAVERTKPDIVFFCPFKDQITGATLREISKTSTTVAWFSDDQWRFDSYSKEYSTHFDVVVTTDPWSVGRYREIGREPILSQWAGDAADVALVERDEDFAYDTTFVGMKTPQRAWFVRKLAKLGAPVECFGHGWKNGRVTFDEMDEIFRTSRVNLNLSNSISMDIRQIFYSPKALAMTLIWKKHAEQIKGRHLELPAAGGFQLSYYVSGIEKYLVPGTEIALFHSVEDCARQIRHYLASPQERIAITRASYERAQREHTWTARLTDVLEAAAAHRAGARTAAGVSG